MAENGFKKAHCFFLLGAFSFIIFFANIAPLRLFRTSIKTRNYDTKYCSQIVHSWRNLSVLEEYRTGTGSELEQPVYRNVSIRRNIDSPFRSTLVLAHGPFLPRVEAFNAELEEVRAEVRSSRMTEHWNPLADREQMKLIWTGDDDYLLRLVNHPQLRMIALPWNPTSPVSGGWNSVGDPSNLLVQEYHEWTGDDTLCTWIETPGTIKMSYDVIYDRTCHRDVNRSVQSQSMNRLVLNAKPMNRDFYWPNNGYSFPECFYTDDPLFAYHLFVIPDCVVNNRSDVFSGNLKLVLYTCSTKIDPEAPQDVDRIPLHDEVFVIAQYWGTETYHKMVEEMPRLALHLDFLRRNQNVKILASESQGRTAELVKLLGLSETRLLNGTVRAKVVYLPRSSMCGCVNAQEIQVLSMTYRRYITWNFPPERRNRLVLIRRTGVRRFTEQSEIERMLEETAGAFNLSFAIFHDNPAPSLNETMKLFHSAVMVVGPHGAGLSNLVFSRPGTYVVEGVCNLPHVNLCFQRLSYVLGHRWHGATSRGGCEQVVDVKAEELRQTVVSYLKQRQTAGKRH